MGRFMSPDPLGGILSNPQSLNKYAYVFNNPLINTDPTGMYVCDDSTECDSESDKKFASSLSSARAALNASSLSGEDLLNAKNSLDAYGAKGVDNGVDVKFDSKLAGGATDVSGTAAEKTSDNPSGQNILVRFNPNAIGGQFSGALVAHEGSHVADGSAWVKSGFNQGMDPTKYQTEVHAYRVEYNIYQATPGMSMAGPDGGPQWGFGIGGVPVTPGLPFSEFLPGLQNLLRKSPQYGADYTVNSTKAAFVKGSVLPE